MTGKIVILSFLIVTGCSFYSRAQNGITPKPVMVNAGLGWAGNSINTAVFRKNSLASFKELQFISYYDADGYVILGKRNLKDTVWQLKKTIYKGNIKDAHNCISIALDGEGFLHMAWDHHNNQLHYCKSVAPLSLELTPQMPMIGSAENKVSYPEFHQLPNGNLLFFYRDGSSGNGNLVINRYDVKEKKWTRLQTNLIDGEGKRNAYWQACIDVKGAVHISWVWRESPDVASNHDMSYAVSKDGGVSWQKSTGEKYQLPISMATAEKICSIPQSNGLINQTSMCTDAACHPYIASYWNGINDVPQYHVIYQSGNGWKVNDLGFRTTDFSLSGQGTKQIPISRPQLICMNKGKQVQLALVFRDKERGDKVSVATTKNIAANQWRLTDLNTTPVGSWEPTYDIELWKQKKQLHLFVQQVTQADGEGVLHAVPQMVQVLEYKF